MVPPAIQDYNLHSQEIYLLEKCVSPLLMTDVTPFAYTRAKRTAIYACRLVAHVISQVQHSGRFLPCVRFFLLEPQQLGHFVLR